ncbi:MAG: hypothetical protein PHW10_01200 [Candidatus Peribacteraceae bacterium]|nr:hypothetical protein [Candidatus Peribacteraceae bacterium]
MTAPLPPGPPDVHPDDVADYLHVRLTRDGTLRELEAAKRVDESMRADPNVRAFVEQLLALEEPTLHPERHPSAN